MRELFVIDVDLKELCNRVLKNTNYTKREYNNNNNNTNTNNNNNNNNNNESELYFIIKDKI